MKERLTKEDALRALRRQGDGEKAIRELPVVTVVNHGSAVLFTRNEEGRDAYLERQRISRRAILWFGAFAALVLLVAIITPPFSQGSESLGIIKIIKGVCVSLFIMIIATVMDIKLNIICERLEDKYTGIGNNLFYDGHEFTCFQKGAHNRCI